MNLSYKDVCSLGTQLRRVYESVPAGRIHVVLQETLKESARRVYQGPLEILGVPDDDRKEFALIKAGRKVKSKLLWSALRSRVGIGTTIAASRSC